MNRKHQCHGVLGHCPLSVRPHESGDPVFPSMRLTPGSPLARGRTEDRTDNEYSSVVPAERRRREAGEGQLGGRARDNRPLTRLASSMLATLSPHSALKTRVNAL